jgi:hypothetical protein
LASEGFVLGIIAATMGTVLAVWGVQLVVRLAPAGLPRLGMVRIDGGVLVVAVGLALVLSLAASLLPAFALFGGRRSTQEGIRLGARSLIGSGRHRLRGALVATEVALSVMLLAARRCSSRAWASSWRSMPASRRATASRWSSG